MLVEGEIGSGGTNHVENFFAFDHVIPNRGATEIDVEIREAIRDAHQAVLLDGGPEEEKKNIEGEEEEEEAKEA